MSENCTCLEELEADGWQAPFHRPKVLAEDSLDLVEAGWAVKLTEESWVRGFEMHRSKLMFFKFCPNCGARMEDDDN